MEVLIKFVDDGEHFHLYFVTDEVEATAEAFRKAATIGRAFMTGHP